MVASTADICAFGWKARDFALKGVDGKTYSLVDVRGPNVEFSLGGIEIMFRGRATKRAALNQGSHAIWTA
jgi:hypothetical protein